MEEINRIIKAEIDKQVQAQVTSFIEHVSRTYDISMKVLLRELSRMGETPRAETPVAGQCLGVNASNGKRCKFSATHNGFCKKHIDQWKPPPPPRSPTKVCPVIKHNHTIPPLFSENCPACAKTVNQPKENMLINI